MKHILPFLFIILFCSFSTADEPAVESNGSLPELKEIPVSGPYCGIYAFLAVAQTFGVCPDVKTLISVKYVGSVGGSTDMELEQAAKDNGLCAETYSSLTWHELKAAKTPMILHFRSTFADNKYNHWVAFLGNDGKYARIIDFPHPIASITFAELMAKWDGTAIAVSDKPIDASLALASRLHYLALVCGLFGAVMVLQYIIRNKNKKIETIDDSLTFRQRSRKLAIQTALIIIIPAAAGIVYHCVSEVGLFRNPTAVAEVVRRYHAVDIPEITLAEMQKIVTEKTTPLFDARYASSFKHGTIPGAVNMPVDSSLSERQQLLSGIDKHQRIVVFCQSAFCAYADEIAQFMKFNGYKNVELFRGGYRDWSQSK